MPGCPNPVHDGCSRHLEFYQKCDIASQWHLWPVSIWNSVCQMWHRYLHQIQDAGCPILSFSKSVIFVPSDNHMAGQYLSANQILCTSVEVLRRYVTLAPSINVMTYLLFQDGSRFWPRLMRCSGLVIRSTVTEIMSFYQFCRMVTHSCLGSFGGFWPLWLWHRWSNPKVMQFPWRHAFWVMRVIIGWVVSSLSLLKNCIMWKSSWEITERLYFFHMRGSPQ